MYSTLFEVSNLKKSLKSGGSRIVAIDDLPHQFQRFHALFGRLGAPVLAVVAFPVQRHDLECRAIQPNGANSVHAAILSCPPCGYSRHNGWPFFVTIEINP